MPSNKELCRRAENALAESHTEPKLIVLLYAGGLGVLTFLLLLVNLGLDNMIDSTGGLSGMGLRAVLSTAQTVLMGLQRVAVPFWTAGYLYAAMGLARNTCRGPKDLLMGFRCFAPLLTAFFYMLLILGVLALASTYLAMTVLAYTPLSDGILELLESMGNADITAIDEAALTQLTEAAMPLAIASTAVGMLVLLIASYRFRLLFYCVYDNLGKGLRFSLQECRTLLRGSKLRLFKLDLHFWWYYLAEVLLSVLVYGDVVLALLGRSLPLSNTANLLLFSGLYLVGQFLLYYFTRNRVQVTYVCFYDELRLPHKEPGVSATE